MPKPAFRVILGACLFSLVVASCGNKSNKENKEKKETADSIQKKPTDPGN